MKRWYLLVLLVLTVSMLACTKSSSDSDDDNDDGDNGQSTAGEFRTDCGVVIGEELKNPVRAKDGKTASIEVQTSNLVIVRTGSETQLVKLHGIREADDFREDLAKRRIRELTASSALYYRVSDSCTTTVIGGGTAYLGQLFTPAGRSINETLLKEGLVDTAFGDDCSGELLTTCYDALEEDGSQFGGEVSDFLWKPESERDGNLAILLNPEARVVVNGQSIPDSGPSNGRSTTARASQPGCAFGSNIRVQAFDTEGLLLLWPGGATEYVIPNGCDRVEFQ